MTDVREWLRGLGLERYAQQFAEHEIDFAALPLLTDRHLAELGLPIGPRVRVLAAAAALRSDPAQTPAARAGEEVIDPQAGERRQITILFADLADSTKLAARLDPEDLRAIMRKYQKACSAVIDRYAGHVAQYMGDGIMAYFGWPTAQEDAAERAVRAGLDLVNAVKAMQGPEPLTVRVGINTGTVVISDTGHGDPSIPEAAAGVTPHIAARLQSLATPNSILISGSTSRLVGGLCEQEPLGPQALKGVADPVPVFRVKQMHTSRFAALRARTLTPFVGRQAELGLLLQRWRDARDGEGQLVYVSGVPGIGKSRIVHELEQRLADDAPFRLKFHCSPHDTHSALLPIIRGLAWSADLNPDDPRELKLEKIRRQLSLSSDHVENAMPLWAELFSVPLDPGVARRPLSAQQAKDQTLFLLADQLVGLARRRPVFCLLEDAQWIDPSTQELLALLPGRIERFSVFFVVTHRPEYQPRLGDSGNVSTLAIARLSRREMLEMTRLALQARATENGIVKKIIEDADAIPLFVEELARGALEASLIDSGQAAHPVADGKISTVPASLRDALVARLDKAPKGRQVAQIAAVISREFSAAMLRRVAMLDADELDTTLAYLVRAEILHQVEPDPIARYAFAHALLRDVAYDSLLRSTRRELHARVAQAIRLETPEVVVLQPELLAYHHSEAGDAQAAVQCWLAGGRRARARWANLEAIGQLQAAEQRLSTLPESAERDDTALEIALLLGLCFITVEGYSSNRARSAFERARALSEARADPRRAMQALFGLWGHYWMVAQHDRALELGRALLAEAQARADDAELAVGHRALGSTLFTLGGFTEARAHLERAIALTPGTPAEGGSGFAVHPRIAAQLLLAWDLWFLGYPDQALANVSEALQRATAIADPYSSAFAHYVTSAVHLHRGHGVLALEHANRSYAISTEHRISLYALYSQFGRGCALALLERSSGQPLRGEATPYDEALRDIRAGIEAARAANLGYMRAFMLGWLAQVHIDRGEFDAAGLALDEAASHVDDVAGRAWQAEIRRLRGDLLLARGAPVAEAAACFGQAIDIARGQQTRSLELRGAVSLARLSRDQKDADQAQALLRPIVAWFTEGRDTADLMSARALLESMR